MFVYLINTSRLAFVIVYRRYELNRRILSALLIPSKVYQTPTTKFENQSSYLIVPFTGVLKLLNTQASAGRHDEKFEFYSS